jgi:hypothetical protein
MANKRNLKNDEKELLAQVFVKTLPLDRIIITDKIGLGGRAYTLPVSLPGAVGAVGSSILGTIGWADNVLKHNYHVNVGDCYHKDMSTDDECEGWPADQLLVHECTHVWQGVHGIFEWDYVTNSLACQALGGAYNYQPGKDWMWYGAEVQAQIVEDWYRNGMLVTDNRWRYIRDNLRKPGFGGQVYFFRNRSGEDKYLRWTIDKGVDEGYPKMTKENWNSFVEQSDAAFSRMIGATEYYYFFKGSEYLKWKPGSGAVDGYPKKIANEWDSTFIKDGIDAALNVDNCVYFFKGDEYIRYTFGVGQVRGSQDSGYPKKISDSWNSSFIKDGFDTCGYWGNGKAYFFKGLGNIIEGTNNRGAPCEYIRYTIGQGVDAGYPKMASTVFNWSDMLYGVDCVLLKRKDVFK